MPACGRRPQFAPAGRRVERTRSRQRPLTLGCSRWHRQWRSQSTLPRYLLDKAAREIAVVGDLDNPNLETLIDLGAGPHPHRPDQARALALLQGDRPHRHHPATGASPEKTVFGLQRPTR